MCIRDRHRPLDDAGVVPASDFQGGFPHLRQVHGPLRHGDGRGGLKACLLYTSALGVNLTKLESRPIPGRDFEFMFYFDLEASVWSPEVVKLLGELSTGKEMCIRDSSSPCPICP